jgi:ATP-dependent protease Clp ATPase subunit
MSENPSLIRDVLDVGVRQTFLKLEEGRICNVPSKG